MKIKLPTTYAVLSFLSICAAAWEGYTLVNRKRGDTFSATTHKLGEEQPFIPLACGMLSKHLWGKNPRTRAAFEMGYVAGEFWPLIDKEEASELITGEKE
jgi:hypothetical protein